MAKWKIYYGDGAVFSDRDGTLIDAPRFNVQIVTQENPVTGRDLLSGWDYYLFQQAMGWFGIKDIIDLIDHFENIHLIDAVLKGRTLNTSDFDAILAQAINDKYLQPKSAKRALETRKGAHKGI